MKTEGRLWKAGERDGLTRQHPLPARKLRSSLNYKIAALGQEIYLCSIDPWLGIDSTLSADTLVPMREKNSFIMSLRGNQSINRQGVILYMLLVVISFDHKLKAC